ncbi:HD domain-containing protein [Kitasatospora sp. NBC_01287]|uniref:HD domain-containing protein n=1 Tax=Kitasatospora sp. NBC_01287 TaxID=2903573 RepID=UPI00225B0BD4|nr:HD domain-containing protein [Kitasatospora sp. NBC_01287]MCX4750983.1 HD domain-containing protein [Kitasatospora sp. NBC_01287]MCX4751766.1 HD domain-containing protein [Kitasatospora sp. NBC_01287]MCX4751942.1 HD domain-containing protein [Kitasatospora sp. NBC_01287]
MPTRITLADVHALATEAHAGQFDKIGAPYIRHVEAVAAGLAPFGVGMQMAGLLHDTLEDTDLTAEQLLAAGVPGTVVDLVQRVTNNPDVTYQAKIEAIVTNYGATLIKIADNAHNSHPDRTAQLPAEKRERLARKYADARSVLWAAVPVEDVKAIVSIVNPALLGELGAQLWR